MSSLHEELAACYCRLADVEGWYKRALEVTNDYKRCFNAITTDLDDLKVIRDDLKKEKADYQRVIGEKDKRLKELEAES